jgi:hypothetical protein
MVSRRLVILLIVLVAACVALFAAAPGSRRQAPDRAPASGQAQSAVAGDAPVRVAPSPSATAPTAAASWSLDGPARLEAVRTVRLFCDLVDAGRLWEAAGLFAAQRVWTRAQLRSVQALSFRSARVLTAPDRATVMVVARVRATVRPESPVPQGAATLFVTLGRVGSTAGGWLIHTIEARPYAQRKGSQ